MSHKNSEKNGKEELETTYLCLTCFRVPRMFSRASHVWLAGCASPYNLKAIGLPLFSNLCSFLGRNNALV